MRSRVQKTCVAEFQVHVARDGKTVSVKLIEMRQARLMALPSNVVLPTYQTALSAIKQRERRIKRSPGVSRLWWETWNIRAGAGTYQAARENDARNQSVGLRGNRESVP